MGVDASRDRAWYSRSRQEAVKVESDIFDSGSGHADSHMFDSLRIQTSKIVDHWQDQMASCYSHLRSALSVIDELAEHPAFSGESYAFDQASGCVWVALTLLDECSARRGVDGSH
jgi:hypothetical protein